MQDFGFGFGGECRPGLSMMKCTGILKTNLQNGSRTQNLSYQYDIVGNIKTTDNGQAKLIYNDADNNYDTDPFNRTSKVEQVMPDGTRYATEYRYDIMGQMTEIRYPNSVSWLTYDYDQMGRLVGIPGFAGSKDNPGFTMMIIALLSL